MKAFMSTPLKHNASTKSLPVKHLRLVTGADYAPRTVHTNYWRGNHIVKTNTSAYHERAVVSAVKHMQSNQYAANVAEVYNSSTGMLYAVIRTSMAKGEPSIVIVFKHDDIKLQIGA